MSALASPRMIGVGSKLTMPRMVALVSLAELAKDAYGPSAYAVIEPDENGYLAVSLWRPDQWTGAPELLAAYDADEPSVLLDEDGEWRAPDDEARILRPTVARWSSMPASIVWEVER